MATVLFAWELGGGSGHCAILRPLIEGLISKGHTVYFAACDLSTAQQVCAPLPVRFIAAPVNASESLQIRVPRSFAHILNNIGFSDHDSLQAHVSAWRNLFELIRPDLTVFEHAPTALLASSGVSTRRAVVGNGFTLPPDFSPWPDLRPWLPESPDSLSRDEAMVLERINSVRIKLGVSHIDRISQLYSDTDLQLLASYRELDPYPRPEPTEYLGNWTCSGGMIPSWPSGRGPRIFAYIRSYAPIWRLETLLSVLRELQYPSVVYIGGAKENLWGSMETTTMRIVLQRVDIPRFASSASLAVLNGTLGTTSEMLRLSIPTLQIPISLEQTLVGLRVSEIGAGVTADPQRPELLALRLRTTIDDPSFRSGAERFARKYSEFDHSESLLRSINKLDELARG